MSSPTLPPMVEPPPTRVRRLTRLVVRRAKVASAVLERASMPRSLEKPPTRPTLMALVAGNVWISISAKAPVASPLLDEGLTDVA